MNLFGKIQKQRSYDAIVLDSGISEGLAAKELGKKGLKTLVLEGGQMVKHVQHYPTTILNPWDFPHRLPDEFEQKVENPIVNRCYAYDEATKDFVVKHNIESLPDGESLTPWQLDCVEKHMPKKIMAQYSDRHVIIGRYAHLTKPKEVHHEQGRKKGNGRQGFGVGFKDSLSKSDDWHVFMQIQGKTIPKESNYVRLSVDKTDD